MKTTAILFTLAAVAVTTTPATADSVTPTDPPVHAQQGMIITNVDRLAEIQEASKDVCPKIVAHADNIEQVLTEESDKRSYAVDERILLGNLCLSYIDGFLAAQ